MRWTLLFAGAGLLVWATVVHPALEQPRSVAVVNGQPIAAAEAQAVAATLGHGAGAERDAIRLLVDQELLLQRALELELLAQDRRLRSVAVHAVLRDVGEGQQSAEAADRALERALRDAAAGSTLTLSPAAAAVWCAAHAAPPVTFACPSGTASRR